MGLKSWLRAIGWGSETMESTETGMDEIRGAEGLEAALAASEQGPAFIFKHSTTCPISASALRRVNEYLDSRGEGGAPFFMVKVIESRPISNEIAAELGVVHQSPQMILVRDRKALWNASHGGIDGRAIEAALSATG